MKFGVIRDLITAGGQLPGLLAVVFHLFFVVCMVCVQLWLAVWASDSENHSSDYYHDNKYYRMTIYVIITCAQFSVIMVGSVSLAYLTTNATRSFHSHLLCRLLLAPMMFFDTTPLGRIMNRCVYTPQNMFLYHYRMAQSNASYVYMVLHRCTTENMPLKN